MKIQYIKDGIALVLAIVFLSYACNLITKPTPTPPPVIIPPIDDPDPPPLPPPPQPPVDTKQPKFYIQWDQRQSWADKLKYAYTEWRGHRDLLAILSIGRQYLKDGDKAFLDITSSELQALIIKMESVDLKGRALAWKIINVKHNKYPDRSQVRKDVVNILWKDNYYDRSLALTINSLMGATAEYKRIEQQFSKIPGCDSIRCRLLVLNNQ